MLSNSSNFQISGGSFVQNNVPQSSIRALAEHCSAGASYDSYARQYKVSCFPGTRTQYIQDITLWMTSTNHEYHKRLFWMQGPAGVGKTTIAQSCAKEVDDRRALGASFFFSRDYGVTNPSRFFTTIAYQLAHRHNEYKDILESRLTNHPMILTKSLDAQFRHLILEPLLDLHCKSVKIPQLTVIVDGLDECESVPAQSKILELIIKSIQEHGSKVPLAWAFFSRPERHIVDLFSHKSVFRLCWLVELTVSRHLDAEIRLYLEGTLRAIQRPGDFLELPGSITPWPPEEILDKLVHVSAGLFIYAATIVKFIIDPNSLGPEEQLEEVLLFHRRFKEAQERTGTQFNPLAELDAFYRMIMGHIPEKVLPVIQQILLLETHLHTLRDGHYVSDGRGRTASIHVLACLLDLKVKTIEELLLRLRSVLTLQPVMDSLYKSEQGLWKSTVIQFHHASFMECLLDQDRSKEFCIANPYHWRVFAFRSIHIINAMHGIQGLPRDQKIKELKNVIPAFPDSTCSRAFVQLSFGMQVYNWISEGLVACCGYAESVAGERIWEDLRQVDLEMRERVRCPWLPTRGLFPTLPPDLRERIVGRRKIKSPVPIKKLEQPPGPRVSESTAWDYILRVLGVVMSSNCLIGSKVMAPVEAFIREASKQVTADDKFLEIDSRMDSIISSYLQSRCERKKDKIQSMNGLELLECYSREWLLIGIICSNLSRMFLGLNLAKGSRGIKPYIIDRMVFSHWRSSFFMQFQSDTLRVTRVVIELITQRRNGDLINNDMIFQFVESLYWLGLGDDIRSSREFYQAHFEDTLVKGTADYYALEATTSLAKYPVVSYLEHIDDRLHEEQVFIEFLVAWRTKDNQASLSSRRTYIKACEDALIGSHLAVLCNEFEKLLQIDDRKHLRLLYSIVSRVPGGTDTLPAIFESHFWNVAISRISVNVTDDRRAYRLISRQNLDIVLDVRSSLTKYVTELFNDDSRFWQSLLIDFDAVGKCD